MLRARALLVFVFSCSMPAGADEVDASVAPPIIGETTEWLQFPTSLFDDPTGLHPSVTLKSPASYDAQLAYPLVIFLHGYGSGVAYSGWAPIAAKNVLSMTPLGAKDVLGDRYWNASAACCDRDHRANDDVTYLGSLIDRVIAAGWHIDPRRVTVIGVSNGGFMAERLACDRSDVVTQIVDLAGATRDVYDDAPCSPALPVSALVDHSEADRAVGFNGGTLFGLRPFPPVMGMMATLDRGSCSQLVMTASGLDHDPVVAGSDTEQYEAVCDRGTLTFWRESASAHAFTPTSAWPDDVWSWMQSHPR